MVSRFQFSIHVVLVITAMVAAIAGASVAQSPWLSVVACRALAVLFASVGILSSLAHNGRMRVFLVGATIPAVIGEIEAARDFKGMLYYFQSKVGNLQSDLEIVADSLRISLIVTWCIASINGVACVGLHRLFWSPPGVAQQSAISK